MTLDPEYNDFILLGAKLFATTNVYQDQLLKLTEEVGEVAEAWSRYAGTNVAKGQSGDILPVAQELADLACTALVAIARLGFSPNDMLQWQMDKVKARHEVWDVRA